MGVVNGGGIFFDLADDPSLAAVEQIEAAAKIGDGANFIDEISGFGRRSSTETAHVRGELAGVVAFVVADLFEHLAQFERGRLLGEFVQDTPAGALSLAKQVKKSFELGIHRNYLQVDSPIKESGPLGNMLR
jgi:hypothetical protein